MTPRTLASCILLCAVFVVLGGGQAFAERQLMVHKGMRVMTTPGFKCADSMTVKVIADNESVFTGDRVELQRMLGGLRASLSFDCTKFKEIKIIGEVAGKPVFNGEIAAKDGWVLKVSTASGEVGQTGTSDALLNPPPTKFTVQRQSKLSALDSLSTGHAQCSMALKWLNRIDEEYGNKSYRGAPSRSMWANLYADQDFVVLFGKPYEQMSARELASLYRGLSGSCWKYRDISVEWRRKATTPLSPFYQNTERNFLLKHLVERRSIRAWADRKLAEISALPPVESNWALLDDLEKEGKDRLKPLWPSERTAFTQAVEARQKAIAPAIAARELVALPAGYESLNKIKQIMRTLDGRDASLDAKIKVKDLSLKRRSELEAEIVRKEIASLKAVPEGLAGLNELKTRKDAIAKKLGRMPEAYAKAAASRTAEVKAKVVETRIADLRSVPGDISGLDDLIARKKKIKNQLGEMPPAYLKAVNAKAGEIASAKFPKLEKSIADTASTFDSARKMSDRNYFLAKELLNEAAPDIAKKLIAKTEEKTDSIYEDIFGKSQREITSMKGSWRKVADILTAGENKARTFKNEGLENKAEKIRALTKTHAMAVLKESKPAFVSEMEKMPATWKGADDLAKFEEEFTRLLVNIPKPHFDEFRGAIHDRRARLMDGIAKDAIAQIAKTKSEWRNVDKIVRFGETLAKPFDEKNETRLAKSIRDAARQRAISVIRNDFPSYGKEIAALKASKENAEMLFAQSEVLQTRVKIYNEFAPYSIAANKRAFQMLDQVCDAVLSRAKISSKQAKLPLLGESKAISIRDFTCDLDAAGHKVATFETPGLLSFKKEYQLKILLKDGSYEHIKLRMVEALPNQEMLVGFAVGDAINQKQTSVEEWQQHIAALDGGAGLFRKARNMLLTDRPRALEMIEASAHQGHPPAQYVLGMAYKEGKGRVRNLDKALDLLEKAAKGGVTLGNLELGEMYSKGLGVEIDVVKALEFYRKAASAGSAKGRKMVGMLTPLAKVELQNRLEREKRKLSEMKKRKEELERQKRLVEQRIKEESQEPTEDEMRAAVSARLNVANKTSADINRRCRNREFQRGGGDPFLAILCLGTLGAQAGAGVDKTETKLSTFKKIKCSPALGQSGFICDFIAGQNINILPGYMGELAARGKYSQGRFIRQGQHWIYRTLE